MGQIKKIDKPCKRCGIMLYNVYPGRLYCDACRETLKRHRPQAPKKPTLAEIMREADKEGLQYASYCKKHGLY